MGANIRIEISDAPTVEIVSRFRDFGEAVYVALRDTCSVSLDEIDSSITSFTVRDIRRSELGQVLETIQRKLRRHGFESTATLTRF